MSRRIWILIAVVAFFSLRSWWASYDFTKANVWLDQQKFQNASPQQRESDFAQLQVKYFVDSTYSSVFSFASLTIIYLVVCVSRLENRLRKLEAEIANRPTR
jgi:hypothetical protein